MVTGATFERKKRDGRRSHAMRMALVQPCMFNDIRVIKINTRLLC